MSDQSDSHTQSSGRDRLFRLLASQEPAGVKQYLFVPRTGVPYASGTGARLLASRYRPDERAFLVPSSFRGLQPIDFINTYVTLDEYAFPPGQDSPESVDAIAQSLSGAGSLRQRLTDLAVLGRLASHDEALTDVAREYSEFLQPDVAERLRNALRGSSDDPKRWLLSRQGVLVAVGRVLTSLEDTEPAIEPTLVGAIMLVHAVGSQLYTPSENEEQSLTLAGMPVGLSMDIIQNELFHRAEEPLSLINRTFQIWTRYADRLTKVTLRMPPVELLRDATGLDILDWLSFGFGLWTQRQQWKPGEPMWVNPGWFSQADPLKRDAFLDRVASDPEKLASGGDLGPPWGFLGLQRTPVVSHAGDYLVLDETFLLERVTSGIYWDVHDAEKVVGERARLLWTQAFGEMLELYVLDILERLAPPLLGDGTNLYREDDFRRASNGKVCDAGIDFGTDFCAVEVVSGQVQVRTRIMGELDGFESDTNRLVVKKARQLHETTQFLLSEIHHLTGPRGINRTRILPVIVNVGSYPVNPVSMVYVDQRLKDEGLLQDPRLGRLCIIDVSELELLEGLGENGGPSMHTALSAWKESDLANMSLRNFLLSGYDARRPARTVGESHELFESMIERLGLRRDASEW